VLPAADADAFSGFKRRFGKQTSVCPQTQVLVCGQTFTLPEQEEDGRDAGSYLPEPAPANTRHVDLRQRADDRWIAAIDETTSVRESRAAYACQNGAWQLRQAQQCTMSVKMGLAWGERLVMNWDLGRGRGYLHPSSKTEGSGRTFQHQVPRIEADKVCANGGDVRFQVIGTKLWSKRLGKKKDHSNVIRSLQAPTCGDGLKGMTRVWDTTRNSGNTSYDVSGHIVYRVTFD
jgi:hypothetical protein